MPSTRQLVLSTIWGVLLLGSGSALAEEGVSVPAGGHHAGSLEARNHSITIGDNATVEGDVENRNGRIEAGDAVTAGNVSTRNGRITLGRDGRFGHIDTRNGSISLGDNSEAGNLESRNGRIEVGAGSRTGTIESRNGAVSLGEGTEVTGDVHSRNGAIHGSAGLRISGDVDSRNGRVELGPDSQVEGSVATRNGAIELVQTTVAHNLHSRSGDLLLTDGSRVGGNVAIEMDEDSASRRGGWLWFGGRKTYPDAGDIRVLDGSEVGGDVVLLLPADYDNDLPVVEIDSGSRVVGSLRIDSRAELIIDGTVEGTIERVEP